MNGHCRHHTVSASDTDVGDSIFCSATATDSKRRHLDLFCKRGGENTDPVVSGTTIIPSTTVYNDTDLLGNGNRPDESLTTYTWTKEAARVTGSSVDLSGNPTDVITCTASATDSDEEVPRKVRQTTTELLPLIPSPSTIPHPLPMTPSRVLRPYPMKTGNLCRPPTNGPSQPMWSEALQH